MPGDRLPLSIQIRRQIDSVGIFSQLFEFSYDFFFARQGRVFRFPIIFWVYTHTINQLRFSLCRMVNNFIFGRQFARYGCLSSALFGICRNPIAACGQIANMADTGLYNKVITEVAIDRFGFSR